MTQNTASLCPGANVHNATYIEYKTFYIEKNLQIVQNYPAAFSNAIQVLLTRSAILLHARSSVGNPQSWQPSPAHTCLWAGSDARGCAEAHGNRSWGAGDSPALVCWPENRTKTATRGYQRPAPACCFLCVTTWGGLGPWELTHFSVACNSSSRQATARLSWQAQDPEPHNCSQHLTGRAAGWCMRFLSPTNRRALLTCVLAAKHCPTGNTRSSSALPR